MRFINGLNFTFKKICYWFSVHDILFTKNEIKHNI